MRIQKEIEPDGLPPARPERSCVPTAADSLHQECVRQDRAEEAAKIVGHPQDGERGPGGEQVTSARLTLRRLQRERMRPAPAYEQRRRVPSNNVLTASPDAIASEVSMLHHSSDATADQVPCEDAVPEETADTAQGI